MIKNDLNLLTEETLKNINAISDKSNIIGKAIKTPDGSIIIPISKITMGILSGGGEYGEIKKIRKGKEYPSSIGTGAMVTIKPTGFFVFNVKSAKIVKVDSDIYDKFYEKSEEFINRIYEKNHYNN